MAINGDITLTRGFWTQLTNANASAIRVQSLEGVELLLMATAGAAVPTSDAGSVRLGANQTLAADLSISQLWPGVTGANRVWAKAYVTSSVSVSHADA